MKKFAVHYSYCTDERNPNISSDRIDVIADHFGAAELVFRTKHQGRIIGFIAITSINRVNREKWSEEEIV